MRRQKLVKTMGILFVFMMVLGGCKKTETGKKPISTEQEQITTKEESTTENSHKGEVRSRLSGKWVKEEIANRRPIAVMYNNIKQAQPQSGIQKADIVYECLVEGGITRLMALFEQYDDLEKIGSVRSARHYYVEIAEEYDAIFAHYGQTKYAVEEIKKRQMDTLSGLSSLGESIYYRDSSRKAPHNAYTSTNGILNGIQGQNIRLEYEEGQEPHFSFYEKNTDVKGESAKEIRLSYSTYSSPYFQYNEKQKEYDRFQYDQPQMDDQTGKQLQYKNVLVQFVKEWDMDHNGYQTMDLVSSGEGYYATLGTYIPITWEKTSSDGVTRYYDETGQELRLNAGKTWISVFPENKKSNVIFE